MNTDCKPGCLCECCLGTTTRTPLSLINAPGAGALRYRVGTYGDFYESMLAALAGVELPPAPDFSSAAGVIGAVLRGLRAEVSSVPIRPLANLRARTTDDPAIAFLDAWAVVLDVLTFYQQRIANEGYLRTATEFRSALELARLVGYRPRPGVGASVFLAYSLDKNAQLTIPAGSKVQSVPASGQLPQTFETSEPVSAREAWNLLAPRKGRPQTFAIGQTTAGKRIWFQGLTTLLKPNDPLIVVFDGALGEPFRVKKVVPDNPSQTTRIILQDFSAIPLLGDSAAALREAGRRLADAIALYRSGSNVSQSINDKLRLVEDVLTKFPPASGSDGTSHITTISQKLAETIKAFRSMLQPSARSLDDLVSRLESVYEYLDIEGAVLTVINFAKGDDSELRQMATNISPDSQDVFKSITTSWSADRVVASSPVSLCRLLDQTSAFVDRHSQSDDDKTAINVFATSAISLLLHHSARTTLKDYRGILKAGVAPDTQVARRVLKVLAPFIDELGTPSVPTDEVLSAFAGVLKSLETATGKVEDLRIAFGPLNEADPDVTKAKDFVDQLETYSEALTSRVNAYAGFVQDPQTISPDDINLLIKDKSTAPAELDALTAISSQIGSADTKNAIAAAISVLLNSSVLQYLARLKKLVSDLENVLSGTNSGKIQNSRNVIDEALVDLDVLESTPEAWRMFPTQQDHALQLSVLAIGTYQKALQQPGTDDAAKQKALVDLRKQLYLAAVLPYMNVSRWLDQIQDALDTWILAPADDTNDLQNQVKEAGKPLKSWGGDSIGLYSQAMTQIVGLGKAGVDLLAQFVRWVRSEYWSATGSSAAPLAVAAARIGAVPQFESFENFKEDLRGLLQVLRQQQSIVDNGVYPRVQPWIDEFTGELDEFFSDIPITLRSADAAKVNSGKSTDDSPAQPDVYPDLGALRKPPSQPPSNSSRLVRELPSNPATNGSTTTGNPAAGGTTSAGGTKSAAIVDLVPQIAAAFVPQLSGRLYKALSNIQSLPGTGFQAIHAVRARSAPFGHNAPQRATVTTVQAQTSGAPNSPPVPKSPPENDTTTTFAEWLLVPQPPGTSVPNSSDSLKWAANLLTLDAVFDKVVPGSYVIIERATPPVQFDLDNPLVARVEDVKIVSPTAYGLQGTTVTQLTLDRPWLTSDESTPDAKTTLSRIRDVTVYLQSEPLPLADEPLDADIGCLPSDDGLDLPPPADQIELDSVYDGLQSGRWLIVAGERTDVPNTSGVTAAELAMIKGVEQVPESVSHSGPDAAHTVIHLANPLTYSYQRSTVKIYGNVVKATHGETKQEILGSGNGSAAGQPFPLKQKPLTYLPALTPAGAKDTLQVRVNGVLWHESADFTGLGPRDRGFVVQTDESGSSTVLFGDGVNGARLPTGRDNVRAQYRVGLGRAGNVDAARLTNLVSRPLGVKDVTNPLPAAGGADPESTAEVRRNAPIGVTALDRLVSVSDYEDFARSFAGIRKASATRLSDGRVQRLHLTIVGANGDPIPSDSDLYHTFVTALEEFGDPALPVTVDSRWLQFIVIVANLKVLSDYEWETVTASVRARLLDRYGFERREFGQDVVLSDVVKTIQRVRGMEAVEIKRFGLIPEKLDEETPTPLGKIRETIESMTTQDTLAVSLAQRNPNFVAAPATKPINSPFYPANIAFLTPLVPDTLILNPWPTD
jgi:phage-related baseplate assembly protein